MNDHELMKHAAKAADVCLHPDLSYSYGNWGCDTTCNVCKKDPSDARWHPLTDDRDAFRLAVKLGLRVFTPDAEPTAVADRYPSGPRCGVDAGDDPYAATRRAIVLAAAEIGLARSKGEKSND